jgi:hypothetical protein
MIVLLGSGTPVVVVVVPVPALHAMLARSKARTAHTVALDVLLVSITMALGQPNAWNAMPASTKTLRDRHLVSNVISPVQLVNFTWAVAVQALALVNIAVRGNLKPRRAAMDAAPVAVAISRIAAVQSSARLVQSTLSSSRRAS